MVETGEEGSLGDVQEAYDIPMARAEEIVEVSVDRMYWVAVEVWLLS